MAIPRLLVPKSELRFSNKGFVSSTRWWFSSSSSSGDGGKSAAVLVSDSSAKTDTSQKRGLWYPWGSVLTNIKQKVIGLTRPTAKTSGEDLGSTISAKSSEVSARGCSSGDTADMPASEGVSLPTNSEETECDSLSLKESSDSEMVSQSVSECVSGIETSQENKENISMKTNQVENNLDGLELAQKKGLELVSVEKQDLPEEPRSDDDSLHFLVSSLLNGASRIQTSLGETQHKSQLEMGQNRQTKSPGDKTEEFAKNLDSDQEPTPLSMSEALDKTSRIFTGEFRNGVTMSGDRKDQFGTELPDSTQKIKGSFKTKIAPLSPDGFEKAKLLDSLLKGHDQTSGDVARRESKSMTLLESFENTSAFKAGSAEGQTLGLRNLLSFIKGIPNDNVEDTKWTNPLPNANLQNPKAKKGESVLKGKFVSNMITTSDGEKEEENSGSPLIVQNGSVCSDASAASSAKKKSSSAFYADELASNTMLVRFLHKKIEKKDILKAFDSYGPILDVQEAMCSEGCIYRDALVTFGKNTAFKKVAKKTDLMIRSLDVVVEATSPEDMVDRVSIPNLIGDPEAPVALVKKPTRTVKIQPLKHGINSNQVKEAFAFCGSNISSFFFGTSSSSAFVEFETEDAKERAIAEHSINIAGRQLFITRIDIPRTTVVRFSSPSNAAMVEDLSAICMPHGKLKKMVKRSRTVCDVHFMLAEWPNMLNILNSLNGKEINGTKLVAQPAPIITPEILSILWEEPQGKRYVKEVVLKGLLRKLEPYPHAQHICRIATAFL